MKFTTPRWWYVRDPRGMAATRALLTPLSWIWAGVTPRRIARATPFDPGVPVICVGNLTAGGTGKTSVVRAIAGRLEARAPAVPLLSHGSPARLGGPRPVDPRPHTRAQGP